MVRLFIFLESGHCCFGIHTTPPTLHIPSGYYVTYYVFTRMGREAMEGLHFLASLPLASTGQMEGGGFSCINKRIISHPVAGLKHKVTVMEDNPRIGFRLPGTRFSHIPPAACDRRLKKCQETPSWKPRLSSKTA